MNPRLLIRSGDVALQYETEGYEWAPWPRLVSLDWYPTKDDLANAQIVVLTDSGGSKSLLLKSVPIVRL